MQSNAFIGIPAMQRCSTHNWRAAINVMEYLGMTVQEGEDRLQSMPWSIALEGVKSVDILFVRIKG